MVEGRFKPISAEVFLLPLPPSLTPPRSKASVLDTRSPRDGRQVLDASSSVEEKLEKGQEDSSPRMASSGSGQRVSTEIVAMDKAESALEMLVITDGQEYILQLLILSPYCE